MHARNCPRARFLLDILISMVRVHLVCREADDRRIANTVVPLVDCALKADLGVDAQFSAHEAWRIQPEQVVLLDEREAPLVVLETY